MSGLSGAPYDDGAVLVQQGGGGRAHRLNWSYDTARFESALAKLEVMASHSQQAAVVEHALPDGRILRVGVGRYRWAEVRAYAA